MGGNDTRVLARRSLAGIAFIAVWLGLASAQAQTITRGPLLQNPDKLASTMTILWWTNVAGDSVVDYGTSPALGSTRSEPQAASCAVGSAGTCHQVTLTGLTPGTRYYYRLSTNGVVVQATTYFQTLRAAGDSGTQFFTVIGDWGQASTGEQQIADLQNAADPQMILSVGDNAYPNGTQSELDNNALAYYREPFKRAIYWPALGNHDLNDVGGAANYANSAHTRTFVLPADAPQAERYYAFESGDALYVVTDSDSCCDSTQRNWLENQLATTTRKWKFVFLHHTPYSCANGFASIGSTLSLRDSWGPLFEQYGVDIVFTGHDHIYERSVLVDHYLVGGGNGSDGLGTRYIMTGGGGATLDEDAKIDGSGNPYRKPFFFSPTEPCPWLTQECPSGPNGYCSIERYSYASVTLVNNETLTVRGIDNNGTVFDTLVLTKANASPTPTASQTPTATHTQIDTPTQTATHTLVPTATHTATLTPTLPAGVPSQTPTATPTHTPTATVTRTATPTATSSHTPLPSDTPTATPTASVTQTSAPPTLTSTPSPTPSPTPPLSCTGPAPANACVPGGGSRRTDCSFEWRVLAPTEVDARGFPKKRIACVEGDPACDADVNLLDGRCTFRVALCLNNADPRLPLCAAAGVTSFEILSPRASSLDPTDQDNFATLLSQVGSGGFGLTVISGSTILSVGAPNTNPDVCSAPLEIDVPLKSTASGFRRGRRVLRVSANTSATQRDRDKLILQCDAP